jgi:hypothetical protein
VSVVKRIVTDDQSVVVTAEDGYIAVRLYFGDPRAEDFDRPDDVALLGIVGAQALATALAEAVDRTRRAA